LSIFSLNEEKANHLRLFLTFNYFHGNYGNLDEKSTGLVQTCPPIDLQFYGKNGFVRNKYFKTFIGKKINKHKIEKKIVSTKK